jgi:hypothetical protein
VYINPSAKLCKKCGALSVEETEEKRQDESGGRVKAKLSADHIRLNMKSDSTGTHSLSRFVEIEEPGEVVQLKGGGTMVQLHKRHVAKDSKEATTVEPKFKAHEGHTFQQSFIGRIFDQF